jgi:hypothetical protein
LTLSRWRTGWTLPSGPTPIPLLPFLSPASPTMTAGSLYSKSGCASFQVEWLIDLFPSPKKSHGFLLHQWKNLM